MAGNGRDIEIATDLKHQRRLWFVERIGWAVIGLLIIAALLGLLGPGPLSKATAGAPHSALWVTYQRFDRYEAPSRLELHVGPGTIKDDGLRVWLSWDYLRKTAVERITPEPDIQEAGNDRVVYVFKVARQDKPVAITFEVRPREFGRSQGRFGVVGGPEVSFKQFVYP